MSEIEQLRQQLQKQEKLASLGLLCAGIAHEIKNPLNFIINFSKISCSLLDDLTDVVESHADRLPETGRKDVDEIMTSLKEEMSQIKENGERAISIIDNILLVQFVPE